MSYVSFWSNFLVPLLSCNCSCLSGTHVNFAGFTAGSAPIAEELAWARGTGPRLVKFGTEVVSSAVPLLASARPTTSLPLDSWRQDLADFPERELLLSYLEDGFPTLSDCAPVSIFSRNHGSFMAFKGDSLSHLREEVAAGRILDCGELPPCWPIRINPRGSVEKRGTSARRRISDMSFPMV